MVLKPHRLVLSFLCVLCENFYMNYVVNGCKIKWKMRLKYIKYRAVI